MVMERSVMSCDQWESAVKGDFADFVRRGAEESLGGVE